MKLNIFSIPSENLDSLVTKLESMGMENVFSDEIEGWRRRFYFSVSPDPIEIPWVGEFADELASLSETPMNSGYFAAYLWDKEGMCLALSFGKAHFYLREFCDNDFGLDMAKRICDRSDVRQKAARRYAGRNRKRIFSYRRDSELEIESGESVDYIQAATRDADRWGKTAKFGVSLLLSAPVHHGDLPKFMDQLADELKNPESFGLPRTEVVKDDASIARYDKELLDAIEDNDADFEESSHQLVGVDFVFSGNEKYFFQRRGVKSPEFNSLSMDELREFIAQYDLDRGQIFDIKIKIVREDAKAYSQELKKSLEYSIDREKVFLKRGEWVEFNDDYSEFLNEYIDTNIKVDSTYEEDLKVASKTEPAFNKMLLSRGYEVADKDLSILKYKKYKIEAWDLKKGDTVFAVKFGSAQKLGYVCDQATNVLELYRAEPELFKNIEIDAYCLWLGFKLTNVPSSLSEVNSIIFKQKLEAWARKCRDMNIRPMVRMGRKL